jgi:hypothetical protein
MEPRWVAAHTERAPDPDAVQLAQMAKRAEPNALRTIPDPQLRAVRIEPGSPASYAFQFGTATDPSRTAQWTIRIVNGQEVSTTGVPGGFGRPYTGGSGSRPAASPGGLSVSTAAVEDALDLTQVRVGPTSAAKAAQDGWPGCEPAALLLHAVAADTPEWTVYCTLPDRRIGWGEVDSLSGKLTPQPLPPPLPAKPARLAEQPAPAAPVDVGCLPGAATPAANVPSTSQEEAETAASRYRGQSGSALFAPVPPPPRLGELLSARPVSYTSADGQRQNLAAWLLSYEWLPSTADDHASRFYSLIGGQGGSVNFGSCFR